MTGKWHISLEKTVLFFDQKRFSDLFGLLSEKKLRKKQRSRKVVGFPWIHPYITVKKGKYSIYSRFGKTQTCLAPLQFDRELTTM